MADTRSHYGFARPEAPSSQLHGEQDYYTDVSEHAVSSPFVRAEAYDGNGIVYPQSNFWEGGAQSAQSAFTSSPGAFFPYSSMTPSISTCSSTSPRPPSPYSLSDLLNLQQNDYLNAQPSSSSAGPPGSFPSIPFGEAVTTLLVKNVPHRLDQATLVGTWPARDSWNLFYMPWSQSQHRHCSYCFINFVSNRAAQRFYMQWQGRSLISSSKARPLNVSGADVQGFWPNLRDIYTRMCESGEIHNARGRPIVINAAGECIDISTALASTTFVSLRM